MRQKLMKPWLWVVLGALALWFAYVWITPTFGPNTETGPVAAMSKHKSPLLILIQNQAKRNDGKVPTFNSKALPEWADTLEEREALVGKDEVLEDALNAKWTYEVPAATVGKKFESLGYDDELIVSPDFPRGRAIIRGSGSIKVPDSK